MKISFMLAKPPPLAQFIQLVPTSSFNLKTTSQRSTTTWEPSLTTFRGVHPHNKRSIQTKSKIQPCNAPTCLLTQIFCSNSTCRYHTNHFDDYSYHSSHFDSYFSWSNRRTLLFHWLLMEKIKILWHFFHSTTMTLQSVTTCNSALPQSTWKRPSTTSTFHPLPSKIILLSLYHVFFNCQLADSFYERIRCRNHGWKVHQSRRKSTPLTIEHGLDMWFQGCDRRAVLVSLMLFTVSWSWPCSNGSDTQFLVSLIMRQIFDFDVCFLMT